MRKIEKSWGARGREQGQLYIKHDADLIKLVTVDTLLLLLAILLSHIIGILLTKEIHSHPR